MNVITWKDDLVFFSRGPICSRVRVEEDKFQEFDTSSMISCLSPDGMSVGLQRGGDGVVEVRRVVQQEWRMNSVEFVCQAQVPILRNIAWSQDSRFLALECVDGTIHVCKAKVAREKDRGKVVMSISRAACSPDGNDAETLAFSPNGKFIAAAAPSVEELAVYASATGELRASVGIQEDKTILAWSPDGKSIAFGDGRDGAAYIWRVAAQTRSPLPCRGHATPIRALAWSPDGSRLATGDSAGRILVWNAASGQSLRELEAMDDGIDGLVWAPNSQKLIAVAAESFDLFDL